MRELLIVVFGVAVVAWAEMVAAGIVHAQVLPAVQPFGYGVALSLTLVGLIAAAVVYILDAVLS